MIQQILTFATNTKEKFFPWLKAKTTSEIGHVFRMRLPRHPLHSFTSSSIVRSVALRISFNIGVRVARIVGLLSEPGIWLLPIDSSTLKAIHHRYVFGVEAAYRGLFYSSHPSLEFSSFPELPATSICALSVRVSAVTFCLTVCR